MRRGLRLVLTVLGAVAATVGTLTLLFGAGMVQGAGGVSPSVDSELRFFGAWYAVAGVLLIRAASRLEADRFVIRALSLALFAAGCGRVLGLLTVGRPHTIFLVLMVLELVIPVVVLPWHAAVIRSGTGDGDGA